MLLTRDDYTRLVEGSTSSAVRALAEQERHEHSWQNGPTLDEEHVSPSPCSRMDDHIRTDVILLQTCSCGATRRLWLGYKDRRRRGDDMRRAAGRAPLGTPLLRSETFSTPKVLQ